MSEKSHTQSDGTNIEEQAGPKNDTSSCGPGCECKTEKGLSNRTKAIISLVIVLAAGAVLTRTIVRKTNTITNDSNTAFATVQPQENREAFSAGNTLNDKTSIKSSEGNTLEKTYSETDAVKSKISESPSTEQSVWKGPLSSMSSLNTVAANNDAVIVLISEQGMQKDDSDVKIINAAAKTITSRGVNIAAFLLKKDAPEFSDLSKQLSGSGVLVMVKGRGMSVVPSAEITEGKLIQAYVAASQPSSGCGPTCAPSDCK